MSKNTKTKLTAEETLIEKLKWRETIRHIEVFLKNDSISSNARASLTIELYSAQSKLLEYLKEPWWANANMDELSAIQTAALQQNAEILAPRVETPDPKKVFNKWKSKEDEILIDEQRKYRERCIRENAKSLLGKSGLYEKLLVPFIEIAELEQQLHELKQSIKTTDTSDSDDVEE